MNKDEIYNTSAENIGGCNRYMCDALEDMRTCLVTRNFSNLSGLIEEVQMYANRMEAKLYDVSNYEDMKAEYKKMKEEMKDE